MRDRLVMATLHIIFDPSERGLRLFGLEDIPEEDRPKVAVLPLADNLDAIDIYKVAQKLAELLLEQLKP